MSFIKLVTLPILGMFLGDVICLDQNHRDLVAQILQTSPKCTVMLYKLETVDVNLMSPSAQNPLLIVDETKDYLAKEMQSRLSVRESYCAILFAQKKSVNSSDVEGFLNQTRHREVYVFDTAMDEQQDLFQLYFKDSVTYLTAKASGNFLFNMDDKVTKILWVKKTKKLLYDNNTLARASGRATLYKKNVTVSAAQMTPFVVYLSKKRYRGVDIGLIDIIAKKIGFNYRVREEKYWHNRDPITHKWTESIGSVIDGLSQFGTTMSMDGFGTSDLPPVEFTPQMYNLEWSYLTTKPKQLQPSFNFIRPFTPTVWLCVLASFILCSIVAFLLVKFHDQEPISLARIIFDMFGTIWQQKLEDSLVSPNSGIYFLIFGFWIIGMTFKGAAYNCDLRAFIFKKVYEKPIDTDEDLVASNLNIFYITGAQIDERYKHSPSPAKRMLYARSIERNTIVSHVEGIGLDGERLVRLGGARMGIKLRSALVMAAFEKHFGYQPLRWSKYPTLSWQETMAMPAYQPWSKEFNRVLLHLIAGGFVDILTRKNLPFNKYNYPTEDEEELEPYRMEHVAGIMSVLGIGLFISLVAACCEAAIFKIREYSTLDIGEMKVIVY